MNIHQITNSLEKILEKNAKYIPDFNKIILLWPIIYFASTILSIPIVFVSLLYLILLFLVVFLEEGFTPKLKFLFILNSIILMTQIILVAFSVLGIPTMNEWLKYYLKWVVFIDYLYLFSLKDYSTKIVFELNKNDKLRKIVDYFVYFLAIFLVMMFIFGFGFFKVGEELRFKGVFYNAHVLSYYLIAVMSWCLLNVTKRRISPTQKNTYLGVMSVFIGLTFLSGARTPFAVSLFIYFIFIIRMYNLLDNVWLLAKIAMIIISIAIILFLLQYFKVINIAVLEKMLRIVTKPSSFLNSRDIIAEVIIKFSKKRFNVFNWLFGYGFGSSVSITKLSISKAIWAHNDLVESFISAGLIGLMIYFAVISSFIKRYFSYYLLAVSMFLIIFNGLFVYQELLMYYPIVAISFKSDNSEAVKNQFKQIMLSINKRFIVFKNSLVNIYMKGRGKNEN